ncbi:hypothetical protein F4806DRAFT_493767 [Annulohypoxylon nitens]|nr:hypothetical protein F4806DRAFT_493767 [Annulohypoxylon nitens]
MVPPHQRFNSRYDYLKWIIYLQNYAMFLGVWDQIDPDKYQTREPVAKVEKPTLETVRQAEIDRRKAQAAQASGSPDTPSSQLSAEASSAASTIEEPSQEELWKLLEDARRKYDSEEETTRDNNEKLFIWIRNSVPNLFYDPVLIQCSIDKKFDIPHFVFQMREFWAPAALQMARATAAKRRR